MISRKRFALRLSSALLLSGLAREAGAWGFRAGDTSLGLRLAMVNPTNTGGLDEMSRRGFGAGLGFARHLADWFAWGVDAEALTLAKENDALGPQSRRLGGLATVFLATGRVNLLFDRGWTPYVLGGAGVHRTRGKLQTAAGETAVRDDGFAAVAAGGIEAFLMMDLSASFEARLHTLKLDQSQFGLRSADLLSYRLGISYWFGIK